MVLPRRTRYQPRWSRPPAGPKHRQYATGPNARSPRTERFRASSRRVAPGARAGPRNRRAGTNLTLPASAAAVAQRGRQRLTVVVDPRSRTFTATTARRACPTMRMRSPNARARVRLRPGAGGSHLQRPAPVGSGCYPLPAHVPAPAPAGAGARSRRAGSPPDHRRSRARPSGRAAAPAPLQRSVGALGLSSDPQHAVASPPERCPSAARDATARADGPSGPWPGPPRVPPQLTVGLVPLQAKQPPPLGHHWGAERRASPQAEGLAIQICCPTVLPQVRRPQHPERSAAEVAHHSFATIDDEQLSDRREGRRLSERHAHSLPPL